MAHAEEMEKKQKAGKEHGASYKIPIMCDLQAESIALQY